MLTTRSWQKPFFAFWTAQAFSMFGSSLAQFALVWWLTETTGSATVLAISTMVAMLPGIFLGPLAGVLVDRWNRRIVILLADAFSALIAAGLALLFWLDAIQLWHIYAAMAVRALAGAFQFPAVQASTSLMAPQEQLARVAGLNQMVQGATQIAAPPLGALLLSVLSFEGIMGIDVITAILAVGLVFLIHIPQPTRSNERLPGASAPSLVSELMEGLRYIWQWPGLRGVLIVSAIINLLLTPAFSLLPILVTRHYGGDVLELAWIDTSFGVGFVAGGLLLGIWGGFKSKIWTSVLGLVGTSAGALLIGLAPASAFWLGLAGMAIVGVMSPIANGPFFAIIQAVVAPDMQGRVFTVIGSIAMGAAPVGLVLAGPVADWLGVRVWYVVGAIACFAISIIIINVPAMMRLEEGRPSAPGATMDNPAAEQSTGSPA